jgi:uncharacterized protein
MIVDCHVNIWNPEDVRPLFREQMARIRPGGMDLAADAETLHAAMQGVDRAIVFALGYGDSAGVESSDATTAAAVARYPDKFTGFAYADPRRLDCMDRLRHAIEELGLKGVKFGPIYNGVALDDPRMAPVLEYCQANDLPLTMHMGTTFGANAPLELGRPIHVDAIARRYPDLKMIMAHMGHPWFEECIVTIRKQPNVYAEVSAIFYRPWQFWNVLITAQEYLVTDKIFWGTDFPFARVEESVAGLNSVNKVVEGTGLPRVSQETIDKILHSNPFAHWWHKGPPV